MSFASFLLRFIGYAFVMALTYEVGQFFWTQSGLDMVDQLVGIHSIGVAIVALAPLVLALIAVVARPLATFALFYLVGAILTAPFALARLIS
jgi:hypothetical protein